MLKIFSTLKSPIFLTIIVVIIYTILWFLPDKFLGNFNYTSSTLRIELKDWANFFLVAINLLLVLVTKEMASVSLNAQKASNRPEINVQLFINTVEPKEEEFSDIKYLEVINTSKGKYNPSIGGANVFLIIKNRDGGGKAINIKVKSSFEASDGNQSKIERDTEIEYMSAGEAKAIYLHNFISPETTELKLINCVLEFTTPFNEASKDSPITIKYGIGREILAIGDSHEKIQLGDGIRPK